MRVLVTGSSSGLGKCLVRNFLDIGCDTIGISRTKSEETDYICNFESNENIKTTLSKALMGLDKIDYLFLNAGTLGNIAKAASIDNDDLMNVFQINLFANKVILDTIINSHVSVNNVILISSGASLKAYDGWLSYCLTKASLNQLGRCYAIENSDIRFISLAPGIIQTKMQDQIIESSSELFSSISKFKELYGKNPTPDAIAKKIIENLDRLEALDSGSYFDLRSIDD
jgi:benzil reductase ((S)-benzoin forming)